VSLAAITSGNASQTPLNEDTADRGGRHCRNSARRSNRDHGSVQRRTRT
jgi:hypothetical protein